MQQLVLQDQITSSEFLDTQLKNKNFILNLVFFRVDPMYLSRNWIFVKNSSSTDNSEKKAAPKRICLVWVFLELFVLQ